MNETIARQTAAIFAVSLLAGCATTSGVEGISDPIQQMAGVWQVRNGARVSMDCANGQRFEPSDDHSSIFQEHLGSDFTATYRVMSNDENGLLLQIVGEERQTNSGDPVKWWVKYHGPDEFRWRRDDWRAGSTTNGLWIRCY